MATYEFQGILDAAFTEKDVITIHVDGGHKFRGRLVENSDGKGVMTKQHTGSSFYVEIFHFALSDVRGVTVRR